MNRIAEHVVRHVQRENPVGVNLVKCVLTNYGGVAPRLLIIRHFVRCRCCDHSDVNTPIACAYGWLAENEPPAGRSTQAPGHVLLLECLSCSPSEFSGSVILPPDGYTGCSRIALTSPPSLEWGLTPAVRCDRRRATRRPALSTRLNRFHAPPAPGASDRRNAHLAAPARRPGYSERAAARTRQSNRKQTAVQSVRGALRVFDHSHLAGRTPRSVSAAVRHHRSSRRGRVLELPSITTLTDASLRRNFSISTRSCS